MGSHRTSSVPVPGFAGALTAAAALLMAACGSDSEPVGGPLLRQPVGATDQLTALVAGVLVIDDEGCTRFVPDSGGGFGLIWPASTRLDESGTAVVLRDGRSLVDGDRLEIGGGIVPLNADPDPDLVEPESATPEALECAGAGPWLVGSVAAG